MSTDISILDANEEIDFLPDTPLMDPKDDKFQRAEFSRQIAKHIINTKQTDSIVYGIYGKWGEGKSTVMNFIEQELKQKEDFVVMKFNPWRYPSEESMLVDFFEDFAQSLQEDVYTEDEKVYKAISEYCKALLLLSPVPVIGKYAKTIESVVSYFTGIASKTSLRDLKTRLDDVLLQNNKKVVVFFDDIDRLDKNEIQALFRLVKLTADFPNTRYVMAFDPDIVADSIGERYGAGDKHAGKDFIEKIVQIKMNLTPYCPEELYLFMTNYIENTLQSVDPLVFQSLDSEEIERLQTFFLDYIKPLKYTIRRVKEFINTTTFTITVLVGEVNTTDIIIMEAIKIFYPELFSILKKYHNHISPHSLRAQDIADQSLNINTYQKMMEQEIDTIFTNEEKNPELKEMLLEIIPTYWTDQSNTEEYRETKRITIKEYAQKYFSLGVPTSLASDQNLDTIFDNISGISTDKFIMELVGQANVNNIKNLILKIHTQITTRNFNSFHTEKIIKATSLLFNKFTVDLKDIPTISHFHLKLFNNVDGEIRNKIANILVTSTDSVNIILSFIETLEREKSTSLKEYLESLLLQKVRSELKNIPLFKNYTIKDLHRLSLIWLKQDPVSYKKHLDDYIYIESYTLLEFMIYYRHDDDTNINKRNLVFGKHSFNDIKKILDVERIYKMLSSPDIHNLIQNKIDQKQVVQSFRYLYNKDKE